ncbi:MAG: response regulator [Cyanobacteria bacterium P01_D01_bin.56]
MSESIKKGDISYLLVDDDNVDKMAIRRAFKQSNIANPLYTADSGAEALELLQSSPSLRLASHVVILLDINIPKMTGIEFLEELRQNSCLKSIPVIVLTTSTEEKDRAAAYDLNVLSYIVKPVKFSILVDIVKTLDKYLSHCVLPLTAMGNNAAQIPSPVDSRYDDVGL